MEEADCLTLLEHTSRLILGAWHYLWTGRYNADMNFNKLGPSHVLLYCIDITYSSAIWAGKIICFTCSHSYSCQGIFLIICTVYVHSLASYYEKSLWHHWVQSQKDTRQMDILKINIISAIVWIFAGSSSHFTFLIGVFHVLSYVMFYLYLSLHVHIYSTHRGNSVCSADIFQHVCWCLDMFNSKREAGLTQNTTNCSSGVDLGAFLGWTFV